MKAELYVRGPDEALSYNTEFFHSAWTEFVELQCTPQSLWVQRSIDTILGSFRVEVVLLEDTTPVGGCILVPDCDGHVGDCLTILFNYVMPAYRSRRAGTVMFREVLRLARRMNFNVVAYTHRLGDWEYALKYRRLE